MNLAPKPQWPELNRAAFLIERAIVPRYYPTYCAEIGQLLAGIEARLQENSRAESPAHL